MGFLLLAGMFKKTSLENKTVSSISKPIFKIPGSAKSEMLKIQIPSITNYKINNSEHLFSGQCADCSS